MPKNDEEFEMEKTMKEHKMYLGGSIKRISFVLILALVFTLLSVGLPQSGAVDTVSAANDTVVTEDGVVYEKMSDDDGFYVVAGKETNAIDIEILPAVTIGGVQKPVTKINESAFTMEQSNLVSIDMSESSIGEIGDSAFMGCRSLSTVIMPKSPYAIGKSAFSSCKSLESIDISNAVYLDEQPFYNCTSLSSITMPADSYELKDFAFSECSSLEKIDISKATYVGTWVFDRCSSLTEVKMKDATVISSSAFLGCSSLRSITMPDNPYTIGFGAFEECTSLSEIDLSNATEINNRAFYGCTALKSANMPNVRTVGERAFMNCSALETVDISNAKSIKTSAFGYCTSLSSITMPKNDFTVGVQTFRACSSLLNIDLKNATEIDGSAFFWCKSIENVYIPKVKSIKSYTFAVCDTLKSAVIPNAESIADKAFEDGLSLRVLGLPKEAPIVSDSTFKNVGPLILLPMGSGSDPSYNDLGKYPAGSAIPQIRDIGTYNENTTNLKLDLTTNAGILLEYQWTRNGIPISGATDTSYTIPIINAANSGAYACQIKLGDYTYTTKPKNIGYYTVSFNKNGGSSVSTTTMKVKGGSSYGTLPTAAKKGYNLLGWYTSPTGGTQIKESSPVTITGNTTLYARWTPKTYKITYNANKGKLSTKSKTVKYDSKIGTLKVPKRSKYNFTGWYTKKKGGTQYTASMIYTKDGNITLYAQWTKKKVVKFNPNGGTVKSYGKAIKKGKKYGKLPNPTRTGYKFKGWYTKKSGGKKITKSSKVKSSKNHTLYARWKKK